MKLVDGVTVTQVRFDSSVTMLLSDGSLLRIESVVMCRHGDEEVAFDPETPSDCAVVIGLPRAGSINLEANDVDGSLAGWFADGSTL